MGILKRLRKSVEKYRKLTRTAPIKRGQSWVSQYESFKETATKLFDIFCDNDDQRANLEKNNMEYLC